MVSIVLPKGVRALGRSGFRPLAQDFAAAVAADRRECQRGC